MSCVIKMTENKFCSTKIVDFDEWEHARRERFPDAEHLTIESHVDGHTVAFYAFGSGVLFDTEAVTVPPRPYQFLRNQAA